MSTETEARRPSETIAEQVTSWPGVKGGTGRRGEFAFMVGTHEIGHLHGDRSAHLSFPKATWRELKQAGRIGYNPVFPGKEGHAARTIESEDDVREMIAMMRLNYDRFVARHGLPDGS